MTVAGSSVRDTAAIRAFFKRLGRFQAVLEATAAYEWFFLLIEDLADRMLLAHYNADVAELFTRRGKAYLAGLALSAADRFAVVALEEQLALFERQLTRVRVNGGAALYFVFMATSVSRRSRIDG